MMPIARPGIARLVSPGRDSMKICGEAFEDLVGGLGPGEGPGVLVPGLDPVADVPFQRLDVLVGATAQPLVGEQAEPALDLVEPGGGGRREMHVKAGVGLEPADDDRRALGAAV